MVAIRDHIIANQAAYIAGGVVLLVLIIVFRKFAVPILLTILEYSIYAVGVHYIFGGTVKFANWFKNETTWQPKAVEGRMVRIDETYFSTPLNWQFYQIERYQPKALFFVEIALIMAVFYVMYLYRPVSWNKNSYKGIQDRNRAAREAARKRIQRGAAARAQTTRGGERRR